MNSEKEFYLQLAAAILREVGNSCDDDRVLYVRKAMMGLGMTISVNGK